MKIKLAALILFCIIAESVIVSYPVTLFAITLISVFLEEDAAFLALAAGLILDFFTIRPLGADSLYFLLLIYLGIRYRKKIYGGAFIYRLSYLVLSFVIYSLIFYKNLNLVSLFATVIFAIIALFAADRLFPNLGTKQKLAV